MAFKPHQNKTQTITVTNSNTNTALTYANADVYEFNNAGTATVFVEWSTGSVTAATTTSYPILPGQCKVLKRPNTATHLANISGTTGQTLYVSAGAGE